MDTNQSPSFHETLQSIQSCLNTQVLEKITRKLILCFRSSNRTEIDRLLRRVSPLLEQETSQKSNGRRLLVLYHPDRLEHYRSRLAILQESGNLDELRVLTHLVEAEKWSRRLPEDLRSDSTGHRTRNREPTDWSNVDPVPGESYGYDDNDTDEVWTGEDWNRADDSDDGLQDGSDDEGYIYRSVLIAIQEAEYGNLGITLEPHHLERIDGELDLSSREVDHLFGIQFCRYVTFLNLSDNRIRDLKLLSELILLEELNLSFNEIESIVPLVNLPHLKYLDLSGNPVEDLHLLLQIPELEVVVLEGCPGVGEVKSILEQKGVIVFADPFDGEGRNSNGIPSLPG